MAEEYALDIWEPRGHRCPNCQSLIATGGVWLRLGVRKTRRSIVKLANDSLSTGYQYRIQERDSIKGWRTSSMRGVKGYGE